MHYRTNFLSKVVLRLDFEKIAELQKSIQVDAKPEFSSLIEGTFPIVAGQPTATVSFNIGPMGTGVNQSITGVQWHHRKKENGTAVVVLGSDLLAVEYGKNDYEHFPPFRAEVALILGAFRQIYQVPVFNRVGLRYINEIVLEQGNSLDWDGYLADEIITAVKACTHAEMDMVRSMHQLQVRQRERTMLFNYGLHNPDFPNTLARRHFILDYDCSQMGVATNDALETIDQINQFCEEMFETSIGPKLREHMEVINDD